MEEIRDYLKEISDTFTAEYPAAVLRAALAAKGTRMLIMATVRRLGVAEAD